MKLKSIAVGTLVLLATLASQATTVSLGALGGGTTALPSQSFSAGSISYDFTFTTVGKDYFSMAGADALSIKFLGTGVSMSSFSASIDGTSFGGFTSSFSRVGPFAATEDKLSYSAANALILAAGAHTLHVQGVAPAASSLNGNIYLVAAPVPEPENFALLLGGLGVIGAIVRRRKMAA